MNMTRLPHRMLTRAAAIALCVFPFCVAQASAGAADRCRSAADLTRLDYPLTRTAQRIAAGEEVRIVAIGSSSTAGAGASSPAASYPSRLEVALQHRFPGHSITVLNRGINGQEAQDMIARLGSDVIAEKPTLVLWQLGTNAIIRDESTAKIDPAVHEGVRMLKSAGADVILIDPQFVPRVIAKLEAQDMVNAISTAAKELNVDVFHRFDVMKRWHKTDNIPFEAFTSPDGLHMNDWGYDCLAKLIGTAVADAAQRLTVSAGGASPVKRALLSPSTQ
jgi:acyl-CoA thioesterase-1